MNGAIVLGPIVFALVVGWWWWDNGGRAETKRQLRDNTRLWLFTRWLLLFIALLIFGFLLERLTFRYLFFASIGSTLCMSLVALYIYLFRSTLYTDPTTRMQIASHASPVNHFTIPHRSPADSRDNPRVKQQGKDSDRLGQSKLWWRRLLAIVISFLVALYLLQKLQQPPK